MRKNVIVSAFLVCALMLSSCGNGTDKYDDTISIDESKIVAEPNGTDKYDDTISIDESKIVAEPDVLMYNIEYDESGDEELCVWLYAVYDWNEHGEGLTHYDKNSVRVEFRFDEVGQSSLDGKKEFTLSYIDLSDIRSPYCIEDKKKYQIIDKLSEKYKNTKVTIENKTLKGFFDTDAEFMITEEIEDKGLFMKYIIEYENGELIDYDEKLKDINPDYKLTDLHQEQFFKKLLSLTSDDFYLKDYK